MHLKIILGKPQENGLIDSAKILIDGVEQKGVYQLQIDMTVNQLLTVKICQLDLTDDGLLVIENDSVKKVEKVLHPRSLEICY